MLTMINPTLSALAEVLLWSQTDDSDRPLDENYSIEDVAPESLEKLYSEYQNFISAVEKEITDKVGNGWDCIDDFYDLIHPSENQTEYDYILTRNHCGAGFWDGDWSPKVSDILTEAAQSQPEICAVVGDDGKIYFE